MELIRVECTEGRQKGKAIFRVPIITFADKRRIARMPMLRDSEERWHEYYELIAKFVPRWEFIGLDGEPLANPEDDPLVFDAIDEIEFYWIAGDGLFSPPKGS